MQARRQPPIWTEIRQDLTTLLALENRDASLKNILWAVFAMDAFLILALFRIRTFATRWRIPGINRLLRGLTLALYGVELGIDVTLGTGVYFVHSTGTVVGGRSVLGDRVRLFGCNTIGTAKEDGEPTIGNDVRIGAGARILGPINVGDRAIIGANAVVLKSLSAGVTAVGIPATPVTGRS